MDDDVTVRGTVAMVSLLAVAACGGAEPEAKDPRAACLPTATSGAQAPEGVSTCQATARVELRAKGPVTIQSTGRRKITAVEFYKGKLPEAAWFVSFQLVEPVEFEGDTSYRAGFQTAPGTYKGNGTYSLHRQNEPGAEGKVAVDDVFLEIVRPSAETKYVRYDRLVEPCTLEVRDQGLAGSLVCPKLGGPDGAPVNLSMEWTAA